VTSGKRHETASNVEDLYDPFDLLDWTSQPAALHRPISLNFESKRSVDGSLPDSDNHERREEGGKPESLQTTDDATKKLSTEGIAAHRLAALLAASKAHEVQLQILVSAPSDVQEAVIRHPLLQEARSSFASVSEAFANVAFANGAKIRPTISNSSNEDGVQNSKIVNQASEPTIKAMQPDLRKKRGRPRREDVAVEEALKRPTLSADQKLQRRRAQYVASKRRAREPNL